MKHFFFFATTGLILLLGLLAWAPAARAQATAPAWQAATSLATASSNLVTATDAAGNVYVAGVFRDFINVGSTTLFTGGDYDIFVARWSAASGRFTWVQRAGGAEDDYASALAVTSNGVYVAGGFGVTASFGATTLTSVGIRDVYVAKLLSTETTGSFVWAQRAGGPNGEQVTTLAASGSVVYVGGNFLGTAAFGSTTLTNTNFISYNGFVARLTDAGSTASFDWAQQVGTPGFALLNSLTVAGGSVYAGGTIRGAVSFGGTTLGAANTTTGFVAKLTDAGSTSSYAWAQAIGGQVDVNGLAASSAGVYVVGRFIEAVSFGGITLFDAVGVSGTYNVFVAKLTDAGPTSSFTWAQQAGGPYADYPQAVAVVGRSVLVTGGFAGTATFGSSTLVSAGGGADVFVTKLLDAGPTASFAWTQQAGGPGSDVGMALAVGTGGTVHVVGYAGGQAAFGSTTLPGSSSSSINFLASFTDVALPTIAPPAKATAVTVFPNPAPAGTTVAVTAAPGPATLTLLDALGRVVRTTSATFTATTPTRFDVRGLPAGVYVLRVAAGAAVGVNKLVVE